MNTAALRHHSEFKKSAVELIYKKKRNRDSAHFTVSSKVDCSRRDVNVHQIVNDSTLDVTFVFVDQNFLSGVEDLDEAVVVLVCLVDGFVQRLVVTNSFPEIGHDLVDVRESHIIRA